MILLHSKKNKMNNKTIFNSRLVSIVLPLFVVLFAHAQSESSKKVAGFKEQVVDNTVQIGYGLALGDVDGDKRIDILMADKKQFVWYRNGDWKRFVMIDSLTEQDNVCITASDVDGDGKVEVAVGAQWIPSETKDKSKSGSVHYLIRPKDPTQRWTAIPLYHEPTVHRMRWTRFADGNFYLIVLPLHGEGNTGGNGVSVNMLVYKYPDLLHNPKPFHVLKTDMHATHNFESVSSGWDGKAGIYIAGKEGIGFVADNFLMSEQVNPVIIKGTRGAGELRSGKLKNRKEFIAAIEPMHGKSLVLYSKDGNRQIIDSTFKRRTRINRRGFFRIRV